MVPSCEKSSARLQPAQADHARLVLNKTVNFFMHNAVHGGSANDSSSISIVSSITQMHFSHLMESLPFPL